MDLYGKIHKAQRAWLFRLVLAAGRSAPGDTDDFEQIGSDAARLVEHLKAHAEHEERFIHPLLREVAPDVEERLNLEHATLEGAFDAIERAADTRELHGALTSLAAAYLAHLEIEERVAMPALAGSFDDGALAARVLQPFAASIDREALARDVVLQLASVDPIEARQVLDAYVSVSAPRP